MQNLTASSLARMVKLHPRISQLYCCGTYDTLFEIGRKNADLSTQVVEVKWRLIVQRTNACGAMLQFYNLYQ